MYSKFIMMELKLLVVLTYGLLTPVNIASIATSFCITTYYLIMIRKEWKKRGLTLKEFLFKFRIK